MKRLLQAAGCAALLMLAGTSLLVIFILVPLYLRDNASGAVNLAYFLGLVFVMLVALCMWVSSDDDEGGW